MCRAVFSVLFLAAVVVAGCAPPSSRLPQGVGAAPPDGGVGSGSRSDAGQPPLGQADAGAPGVDDPGPITPPPPDDAAAPGKHDAAPGSGGKMDAAPPPPMPKMDAAPPAPVPDAAPPPPVDPGTLPGAKPVLVVGGERGLRMISRDLGRTWSNEATVATPVDAEIQGAAWGGGKLVLVGVRSFFVSADEGATWKVIPNGFGWLQAVAYGNGRFVAVGGGYLCVTSPDGETWTKSEDVGPNPARTDYNVNTVVFDGSDFYATGVDGGRIAGSNPERWNYRMYKSKDGTGWSFVQSVVSGGPSQPSIEVCGGAVKPSIDCGPTPFHVGTVYFRFDYPGKLMRSLDGKAFSMVKQAPESLRAFAVQP